MTTTQLTHPKRGRTITVDSDRADTYRAVGWVDVPAKSGRKKKGGTAPRTTRKDES